MSFSSNSENFNSANINGFVSLSWHHKIRILTLSLVCEPIWIHRNGSVEVLDEVGFFKEHFNGLKFSIEKAGRLCNLTKEIKALAGPSVQKEI
jgi:hypothetical protein